MSELSVFCPSCGARNPATALFCAECGRSLPTPEQLAALWGSPQNRSDERRGTDPTSQPTAAFTPTNRFGDRASSARPSEARAPGARAPDDPWADQQGRRPPPPSPPARRRGGPGGCILAILALLLICVVGGALVGLVVVRPYIQDRTRDELRDAAATQVREIGDLPLLPSGELVVTEEEINRSLRGNEDRYAPAKDPRVDLFPGGFEITFKVGVLGLSGAESSYTGEIETQNGRLVVVNGDLDGPAAQVFSADDLAEIAEEQFAILLANSDVRATGVEIENGQMTVTTEPA